MSRLIGCALAWAWVVAGCGPAVAPVAPAAPVVPAETAAVPVAALAPDEAQARRQAWLREVEGYLADPATLPRLADPAGRARFEALVSERAWREIDVETMAREGVIAAQPADTSQVNREHGLEQMRIGAAINLGALLDILPRASAPIADRVMDRLEAPSTYAMLSSGSTQLFLATLDDRWRTQPTLRAKLESIRYAAGVTKQNAGWPPSDRDFEAMAPWPTFTTRAVASKTGGFTVDVGTPPLVWRRRSPGSANDLHELEWRDGELLFEVTCFDHGSEETLAGNYLAAGGTERKGPGPGRWFSGGVAGLDAHGRMLTIRGRVCVASVQAPIALVDIARFDALLGSLRPTP